MTGLPLPAARTAPHGLLRDSHHDCSEAHQCQPRYFLGRGPGCRSADLCGCPVDAVKHLRRLGLIVSTETDRVEHETGPNAILLSDLAIQNGHACRHAEFPVLQMLYKQGMIVPDHPRNTGVRPLLIGSRGQVEAQSEYLFRGNYGLVSREEQMAAGLGAQEADEQMRIKLAFAFGRIMPTDELLHSLHVGKETAHIRNGVSISRLRTNVFEIAFRDERVEAVEGNEPAGGGTGATIRCVSVVEAYLLNAAGSGCAGSGGAVEIV